MRRIKTNIAISLLTTLALATVAIAPATAQEWTWGIDWSVSIPTGDTKEAIDKTSFRGIGIEGRKWIKRDTTFGLSASWNVFDQKGVETTEVPSLNGAVTGTQFRYLNVWPLFLNAHKYWGPRSGSRFYVGLNAGGMIVERRVDIGLTTVQDTQWQWGGAPEVGFLLPRGRFLGFVNVRYNYAFESGDFSAVSFLGINVGLGLQ